MTGMEGFDNLVNMNDSRSSDRTMSIQRPSCFFNLWSSCSSGPNQRRPCHLLLPPMSGCAATAGHAIPLYSPTPPVILRRRQPHTAAEAVNPRLPRLRVVPFLGLIVVHGPGALGATWSMWSTNDFHQKSTVHGEAGSWVHGRSKEVPPYYAQNNYSST